MHRFYQLSESHMLVLLQDHRWVFVAHNPGNRLDVCANIQGLGRKCMSEAVGSDPTLYASSFSCLVPGMVDMRHFFAVVVYDVFAILVLTFPLAHKWHKLISDGDRSACFLDALISVWHMHYACGKINI